MFLTYDATTDQYISYTIVKKIDSGCWLTGHGGVCRPLIYFLLVATNTQSLS
jgi:hypothetical protein